MTLPFLFMMNITMLARLVFYSGEGRLSKRRWLLLIIIPYLGLGLFEPGINLWLLFSFVSLLNVLTISGDLRFKQSDMYRFIVLILFAVLYSIFFSPTVRLDFNRDVLNQLTVWAGYSSFSGVIQQLGVEKLSVLVFGVLLVSNEINLLVRACFRIFGLLPVGKAQKGDKYLLKSVDARELNAGRLIGILERIIMLLLVAGGSVGSIGFVLAAKAFARFRDLDERAFAEYVLVGTLLSTLLAVMAGYFLRAFL